MKQFLLKDLFTNLQNDNLDYIVLRKHELIPNEITLENDLDLLCKLSQRKKLLKLFSDNKYRFHQDSISENIYLYDAEPHNHFLNDRNDLHIDVVYNLSYKSPNKGEWVSVHKEIQEDAWKQVVTTDTFWKFKLSPLDELIHVICHCLLDKKEIDDYYRKKIQDLFLREDKKVLEKKLSLIFFNFSSKLIEYITNNDFSNIFMKYISFKDY